MIPQTLQTKPEILIGSKLSLAVRHGPYQHIHHSRVALDTSSRFVVEHVNSNPRLDQIG